MSKANDRVTIMRPNEIVELVFEMVEVAESEAAETDRVAPTTSITNPTATTNGKSKPARAKPRKKKPARRPKA